MSCAHEWRIEYAPVGVCSKCREREEEVDAYRRGAEAMREACAEAVASWGREQMKISMDKRADAPLSSECHAESAMTAGAIARSFRTLPIPEDKP